jgi:lipopolysaccharide transport system ATP-binding protein
LDDDVVIQFDHVSKKYCKSLKRSMLYGVSDIGRNLCGLSSHSDELRKNEFWAVNDVSFELKKGESLGLIGPNGSGKSTILKMLNGIFWPDKGKITVRGRVGALIEVGAGFHPFLTGRENVYLNGAILGMKKEEVDARFESITEFAGVGDFIDVPVKAYSSGMFVRLGFAIAVHCEPDVLLVDEILAVGDEAFHRKCFNKIGALVKKGVSIILVSHNLNYVNMMTSKCILLEKGKILKYDRTNDVVNEYFKLQKDQVPIEQSPKFMAEQNVILRNISVCDQAGVVKNVFNTGEKIRFCLDFDVKSKIHNPIVHLSLYRDTYHGYNTKYDNVKIDTFEKKMRVELDIEYCGLGAGVYTVGIAVWDQDFTSVHYWNWTAATIQIESEAPMMGRFICEHKWRIEEIR